MNEAYADTTFFQGIDLDCSVLTPNRRLSAILHKLYNSYQLTKQKKIWRTPDILPLSSWFERLWQNHVSFSGNPAPLLLNHTQELFLWEQIITKKAAELLQISETAELAKSAWDLLKQWQIDFNQPSFKSAEDYNALQTWSLQFQAICEQKNVLDKASLPDYLLTKISTGEIIPPKKIILLGFTELSPQLKKFLKACEKTGTDIKETTLVKQQGECYRISLEKEEDEIITAARWAKAMLKKNPNAKIGCVIPSLDKKRDRVQQIFTEIFTTTSQFNISAGKNLLHYPIIHTALQLLSLHKKNISIETFSYLMASPFIGEAEIERIKRANTDSVLRQKNITQLNLHHVKTILENNCPYFFSRAQKLNLFLDQHKKKQTYNDWSKIFSEILTILGWPGERSLNSEEYQVVENWLKLLANFALLDQVATPVSLSQALHSLHKMTSNTVFQPQTPEASVQVLGILEAAAIPFDYLWVAGLDDLSWPAQPKPNPLIPKNIQRELNMPHATAERELTFCRDLTDQFKKAATTIIFSHAEKNDDLELQASPLIREFPKIEIKSLALDQYESLIARVYASKKMEIISDEIAPTHSTPEKIVGGVSILKQQALCPFKAFAEWRLHAREMEKLSPGLRSKDRGILIHRALEILWNQLKKHQTLITCDDQVLHELIDTCINQAINALPNSHTDSPQYIRLEKERMQRLIWDWLQIEKEREPFIVISSEKAEQISLNELTLSIRVDRIDELSNGKKLIIDYKTGKNNEIGSWFSERPEEPQLPLYSLIDANNTSGISFAQVVSGEHCFKGVSQYALGIKGIKLVSEIKKTTALSWEEQLTQWKAVLSQLTEDFYQGKAHVAPKEASTCLWCALKPLCRVNEEIFSNDGNINS